MNERPRPTYLRLVRPLPASLPPKDLTVPLTDFLALESQFQRLATFDRQLLREHVGLIQLLRDLAAAEPPTLPFAIRARLAATIARYDKLAELAAYRIPEEEL